MPEVPEQCTARSYIRARPGREKNGVCGRIERRISVRRLRILSVRVFRVRRIPTPMAFE